MSGNNLKKIGAGIWYFLLITGFFYLVIMGRKIEIENHMQKNGGFWLTGDNTEWYPGKLYTHEDFTMGRPMDGETEAQFGTRRIVLSLEKGQVYGLAGQSATYAQRIFVDGVLLSEIGKVSDKPENFVPRTDYETIYFIPQQEETEFIIQYAWFNHQEGSMHNQLLGKQEMISDYNRIQFLSNGLMTGTLLAISVFFFGMFLFGGRRKFVLWFAIVCFSAGCHYLLYYSKDIMVLFPDISWYVAHKLEYVMRFSYYHFMLLFGYSILELQLKRWLKRLFWGVFLLVYGYYIFTPSVFYTRNIIQVGALFTILLFLMVGMLTVYFIRMKEYLHLDKFMVWLSILITTLSWMLEAVTYHGKSFYLQPYVTILFVFCNAVVLTVRFARVETQLQYVKNREREIARENAMLEQLNFLKSNFIHNVAHELKTPLTVMSGYAQLTSWEIKQNDVNEGTLANLNTIKTEALRLAELVTKLLTFSNEKQTMGIKEKVDVSELLAEVSAVCIPVLQKKENRWETVLSGKPMASGNKEMMLQVMINLIINGNRHTEKGCIRVAAEQMSDGFVHFRVSDEGSGIAADNIPHIFERGYSGDGSSGLGLAICKELLEGMGGFIEVEQTGIDGTIFHFKIPVWEEE